MAYICISNTLKKYNYNYCGFDIYRLYIFSKSEFQENEVVTGLRKFSFGPGKTFLLFQKYFVENDIIL